MKKTLFVVLTLFLTLVMYAQDYNNLDRYLDTLNNKNKFMGTVLLAQDGKIVYNKSVGYSDVNKKQLSEVNSQYKIGSISKTFTATLIMKAIEEGKLQLDDKLDTYYPSIQNADKITIKQLLSHRTGIHNFTSLEGYFDWNTQPKTESEMLTLIKQEGSDFKPDSTFSYSNSNYYLLAKIIERTYKDSFKNILHKKIIKPLGLKNTTTASPIDTPQECQSYQFSDTWEKQPETHGSIILGAGDIVSTTEDLMTFCYSLFHGKIVNKASLDLMKTMNQGYGLGIYQVPYANKQGYGHNGGVDGFTSTMYYFEDGDIVQIQLSNGSDFNTNDITLALLNTLHGVEVKMPVIKEQYQNTKEDISKYVGVYKSELFPLDITITNKGRSLFAQATGQPSFKLDADKKDTFSKDAIKLILVFDTEKKTMSLTQFGMKYEFVKE